MTNIVDLPDDVVLIIVEYVAGDYFNADQRNVADFYNVNKRFYQYSNYWITRYKYKNIYLFPPRSRFFKCVYSIHMNSLTRYIIWNFSPFDDEISISNEIINIRGKKYITNKEECNQLLTTIYDAMPNYMKTVKKRITLSLHPFPLFDNVIYNYLKL